MSPISSLPLTRPGQGRGLLDVLDRRFLLKLIVRKELRVRYRGSVLGMAWTYVKPAVQFAVYFFAMGVIMAQRESVPNFAVYLFSGIVVMNFFGEGFLNATRSILWNAPLINKIYLPRELFPVASLWVSAVHFFPQFLVLLAAALVSGWRPTLIELAAGALGFVIVAMLSLGLGLLFGAVNVYFRDAENLVELIVMVATWASPVLYPWILVYDNLPRWLWLVYMSNPLTAAVQLFHYAFWFGSTGRPELLPNGRPPMSPDMWGWAGLALAVSLALVVVGQLVFRRLEGRFAQEL
ncbi:ABC-2 type transporter [Xylanimonas cellulosilytica DSM 15894]|uniref:Transport permease protein n=1 Tax=Xylanimonas cellulosilytica (strain DSM 15894 / JCM 12276 / CECT 5975 / KCTC 9989 / LMG 20990 / NBRC 107835 / XIL07) TaxID=446471 RepID=D1BX20_XYLCX|nr:ABC-2 type transporter [Xylanimonas cellulosilytica DSM 15894]